MSKSTLFTIYVFIALVIPVGSGFMAYLICEGNIAATIVSTVVGIYLSIIFLQEVIYSYDEEPESR